ncbi:hypothetical protein [Lentibacillus sp. CBA3610]|nr:hypothetical protein [Lentibacillus sp. CBA3610]
MAKKNPQTLNTKENGRKKSINVKAKNQANKSRYEQISDIQDERVQC